MTPTLQTFTPDLFLPAAQLLAARHRFDRRSLPLLPKALEDETPALAAVQAAAAGEHTQGMAALENGRLVGYMLGALTLDMLWGRSAWVRPAGLALEPGQSAELARDMYAALAEQWVNWGVYFHFAVLPVSQPHLIEAFYHLSFGIEHIYALMECAPFIESAPPPAPGLVVRRAGVNDRSTLEALSTITWQHQVQSPVFGIHLPETEAGHIQQYGDLVADPEAQTWLAFNEQEQALGVHVYYQVESAPDNLLAEDHYCELVAANTMPQQRRRGIARALLQAGLADQVQRGRTVCQTDWRATNLLSSRAWPSLGFKPYHYRLVRRIDDRIAWAR